MITKLRGGMDSIFVNLLLGVLIAAFAIFGIGPGIFGGNANVVATVGEADIDRVEYELAVRRQASNLQQRFQAQMSAEQIIKTFGIDRQVLNQMITQEAFAEDTRMLGMRATDAQVAIDLKTVDAFKLGGNFSRQAMNQLLSQNQMTEKQFLNSIAKDIPRRHLVESLIKTSVPPRQMAEMLYGFENERRTATIINIAASEVEDITAATEEELLATYEVNKGNYMTPERRSYDYVLLSPQAFMKDAVATEEDAEIIYNSRIGDFVTPEVRSLLGASFTSKEDADAFIEKINSGSDFVKTAALMTEFTEEEISIGDLTKAGMETDFSPETATEVFALLQENSISKPLESLAGWNVFRVTKIDPGTEQTFEEVKETLLTEAKLEKATDLMYDFVNLLEDDLSSGAPLSDIVEKHELSVASVSNVDSNGIKEDGTPSVTTIEGRKVLETAYSLEEGEQPELLDVDSNDASKGMYMTDLKLISEPSQKSFEIVKPILVSNDLNDKKMKKAGEIAETALEKLQAGIDPEDIINELGGTSYNAKNIGRKSTEKSNLSQNLRDLLFSLKIGASDLDRAANNDGYMIIRTDAIHSVDLVKDTAKVDSFHDQLIEASRNDILDQYRNMLTKQLAPTINNALVQQLFVINE